MDEIKEEIMEELAEIPQRVNPFCVIRKEPWGDYNVHDIQDNTSWSSILTKIML